MKQQITSVLGLRSSRNASKHTFKTKLAMALLLSAMVGATFTSCDNYPEGPLISLTSKTDRVTNNWKIAQAIENGTDVTSNYNQYELNLSENGTAKLTAKYTFLGVNFDFETNGTWAFVSDSQKIAFNYENDAADGVYQILKLKEDEMWLQKEGEALELHYVTQ